MDPITFTSPNSYIPVYTWKDYPKLNSFSIEFQTTENYGILAYILGPERPEHQKKVVKNKQHLKRQSKMAALNRDFFALEIHNRFLNAYFNMGNNYIRHEIVHEHVSSGKSHQITVEINDKYAVFRFDQKPETSIRLDQLGGNETMDLTGPLIIGGLYPNHTVEPFSNPSKKIPPYFYSGMLGHGYVGCIQDAEVNGQYVNLTKYATQEGVSGVNTDMCAPMPNQCDMGHCMNDGVCMEGWNRFYCDCAATGFNGPICNQRKLTFFFIIYNLYVKYSLIKNIEHFKI
jgi:neurexin